MLLNKKQIIDKIKNLNVMELLELIKDLEEMYADEIKKV